jgi:hypothetical protein
MDQTGIYDSSFYETGIHETGLFKIKLYEVGVINMAGICIIFIDAIAMYFTLQIYTAPYLILLLICCLGAILTVAGVVMVYYSIDLPYLNEEVMTCVAWILYVNTYLIFLSIYYKDLLKSWQIRICYTANFINLTCQCIWSTPYCFNIGVTDDQYDKILEYSGNIQVTSVVFSETFLTLCIFNLIVKVTKSTYDTQVRRMLIKVSCTMITMWLLDIVVLYLDYSGLNFFSYITKPLVISFKFFIELLILGYCKKQLYILSGMDNW